MRLLADENLRRQAIDDLRAAGCDSEWARFDYPGWKDPELLELAEREGRILLTLDRDFVQIARQRPQPLERGGVVLFRAHPATATNVASLARRFLELDRDWTGTLSQLTIDEVEDRSPNL